MSCLNPDLRIYLRFVKNRKNDAGYTSEVF